MKGMMSSQVPPLCECGKDEYVKQKCDRQTGRHVVCGSCTANCGAGGSCSGPRKGECTTCGDMISDAESSDEATARKMFMSIADTSDTVQGICEPCRLSCPKGSYMAKPCAADKNAECKTCSRCQVLRPACLEMPEGMLGRPSDTSSSKCRGEASTVALRMQGRSSIFMDCDAQRGFDTICVTGDPVDMPFLEPRVPILLQKASDEVNRRAACIVPCKLKADACPPIRALLDACGSQSFLPRTPRNLFLGQRRREFGFPRRGKQGHTMTHKLFAFASGTATANIAGWELHGVFYVT